MFFHILLLEANKLKIYEKIYLGKIQKVYPKINNVDLPFHALLF
jgi:hypothetical protein